MEAKSSVVFNPDKVFGYNLDKKGIHPTEEMKDAIRGFELLSIKMMRAFMGLIAQVTWTLDQKTRNLTAQLRNKLRGADKLVKWTAEETEVFNQLKLGEDRKGMERRQWRPDHP